MSALRSVVRKSVFPQIRYSNFNAIGKLLNQSIKPLRPLLRGQAEPRRSRTPAAAHRVSEMREDFLSVASHELKTPLTSLKLQVQLISRMAKAPKEQQISAERLQSLADNADRQISRMTFLINNILEASGMRAGMLQLNSQEFDLAQAVRSEVEEFKWNPAFAQLDIQLDAPSPILGRWDRERIGQIVRILLSNAATYGMSKPIELSVSAHRGKAHVSVRDYGIGISKQDQDRIFKLFERGVPAANFGGMGLGLYIAQQLALAHQGNLSVESEVGKGSVFVLKLPVLR